MFAAAVEAVHGLNGKGASPSTPPMCGRRLSSASPHAPGRWRREAEVQTAAPQESEEKMLEQVAAAAATAAATATAIKCEENMQKQVETMMLDVQKRMSEKEASHKQEIQKLQEVCENELHAKDVELKRVRNTADTATGLLNEASTNIAKLQKDLEGSRTANKVLRERIQAASKRERKLEEENSELEMTLQTYLEADIEEQGSDVEKGVDEEEDEEEGGTDADMEIHAGSTVRLLGLKARPDLNGKVGVTQSFDVAKERWVVQLECGERGLFKAETLELLEAFK